MKITDEVQLSPHALARQVGEETMVLDLVSGTYFGLDPVGGRFWQLVEDGRTAQQARDALLEEFEVEQSVLDHDLEALLEELERHGLVNAAA